jgi:hypothetical protein
MKSNLVWAGIEDIIKAQDEIRQTIKFSEVKTDLLQELALPAYDEKKQYVGKQITVAKFQGKKTRFIRVYGAAGEEDIPETKVKEISDHYKPQTRKFFTEVGLRDPIIAPALDRLEETIFEDGFELVLEPASTAPEPNQPQTEQPQTEQTTQSNFETARLKLQTWCEDHDLLHIMRNLHTVKFCQGKAAALISPGLADLQQGELPSHIEVITAEDLGNPIVDVGLTRKLVGVTLALEDKKVARADEIVYIVSGKQGLRREGKFQGISKLEPVLIISKIIRRIYDFDFSEAVIAAYITRTLFKVKSQGEESEQKAKLQKLIEDFFKAGKIAFAVSDDVEDIISVQPKVDWTVLEGIEQKLSDLEQGLTGVPKSMMNRTENLNRDTATIQAIQYKRFVVKPAEKKLATEFENQLLNPLFAKLVGKEIKDIPFRVRIKKKLPEEGDIDTMFDRLSETKNQEISAGNMMQGDARSTFGASGQELLVQETKQGYIVKPYSSS